MAGSSVKIFDFPRSVVTVSVIVMIIGLVLYLVEKCIPTSAQHGNLVLLTITLLPAAVFAILSSAEIKGIEQQRRQQSQALIGVYMLFKGLRLILTLVAVLAYIMLDGPARMCFIINIGVLFLACLVLTSYCHLRAESADAATTSSPESKPEAN